MQVESSRPRREIGIRVAIGARPSQVLRLVLARTLTLVAGGVLVGAVLMTLAANVLASIVFGASVSDPFVLGGVALGLGLSGTMSCWIPVRRVLGTSPISALRAD